MCQVNVLHVFNLSYLWWTGITHPNNGWTGLYLKVLHSLQHVIEISVCVAKHVWCVELIICNSLWWRLHLSHCSPWHWTVATTGPGGQWIRKSTGPPKNPLAPLKTCNDPNVFAAGIYDFTREVAHFCTLGLYITKNKYELTLPFEFCRFPVKRFFLRTKKKKKKKFQWPLGWKINCGGPNWPDSLKKACGPAGT